MTPTTVGAGYLLIGVFLMFAGYGIVHLAASAWAERRARRTEEQLQVRHDLNAQTMAHILGDDLPTPLPVTKFNDLAYRQHIADARARIEASNVVPMRGRLRSIPAQRDGGA